MQISNIKVIKRNGDKADFESAKIFNAIKKAMDANNKTEINSEKINEITASVVKEIIETRKSFVSVEEIQDLVEKELSKAGFPDVAKAYILYREKHRQMRNVKETVLNYKNLVDDYLKVNDWRVKENSTVGYSLGGLILSNSGAITANYWLSEVYDKYDKEISEAQRNADIHIHDLGMLSGYCAGWSLKQLLLEGIGGVPGKITSAPASHLSTLCNQIVNFLGIMQNEWAGAQALSSFDTYLAPFVKIDNLSYREVKQCIQSLIFGLNTPSRWGCLTDSAHLLTTTGFKTYDELKKGDLIYTWNNGKLEIQPLREIVIKKHTGKLQSYYGEGYNQTVTPEHRILCTKDGESYGIVLSKDLYQKAPEYLMPVRFKEGLTDDMKENKYDRYKVMSAAKEKTVDPGLLELSGDLLEIYMDNLPKENETEDAIYIRTNDVENEKEYIDFLQHLLLRYGFTSYQKDQYVVINKRNNIEIGMIEEKDYDGIVWCPNVENGTAVFRYEGCVFISGNCQAPFTNVTLDWTVPDDLAEEYCIIGGKRTNFKYKDCKKEMDMINKAFIEIMIEGDANGRGFQYPIPTYSITKEFDWSETENNKLLFEMTAKYGTPYFSNYVNSDMNPQDIRSMCPIAATEDVLVWDDYLNEFHISNIKRLYKSNENGAKRSLYILHNGKIKRATLNEFNVDKIYEVELINGQKICFSDNHTNLTLEGLKKTNELTEEDYLPFNIVPYLGNGLSYEEGYLVGAFLGDGSYRDDRTITYSVNDNSKKETMEKIIEICEKKGAKWKIQKCTSGIGKNGCVNLSITSKYIKGLVEEFVIGNNAHDKYLHPRVHGKSLEFRKGIKDGIYDTDGGNRNRIYSVSKKLIDSLTTLFATMGIASRINIDERGADKTLSDNPVWTIRFYNIDGLNHRTNVFQKKDGYMWFRIKNIKEKTGHLAYCFEVEDDEEPYFMLPSGLVTHNCRLRLDLRELRKKGGGYFGSGESTGSIGVVTINLPRIAYLAKDEKDFYDRLDHLMDISAKSLKIKRDVISKLMEQGLYPYTQRYLGSFNNHFSTIGLIGMNETGLNAKWLRKDMTHPETQKFAKDVLNHMRERLVQYQEIYGDLYNLEATPK